ncbi:hypothetical protein O6H91_18G072300 [Diphasiastrum complanatum]|nr:hypothetical protein O6H91_18G072300 [Diphasiastrum complanatum]
MVYEKREIFAEGKELRGYTVAAPKASEWNEAALTDDEPVDYVGILNRALPLDIRVLGWCPVPLGFHARFSCLSREYKYFFINSELDVDAMRKASKSFLGDHDFRNFCKMDAKNVHNYRRTIIAFDIFPVETGFMRSNIWVMQVKGSAFLWHQVRCMAAVLLMVGYGYESPSVVQELLDLSITPRKPQYAMASEFPLVLHACAFDNLTFQCSPEATNQVRLHLENLMGQEFIKTAIFQDGLPSVVLSRPKTMLKRTHIPLQLHETEPTYEERRLSKSKAT